MLTTSYPRYEEDFAGVFVHSLAKKLQKDGVEVTVVAPHASGVRCKDHMDGIEAHRFRYAWPYRFQQVAYGGGVANNVHGSRLAKLQLPYFFLSYLLTAYEKCRSCDVIHAHWTFSALMALLITQIRRRPVVVTVHGSDVNLLPDRGPVRDVARFVLSHVDALITVSNELRGKVCNLGVPSERVVVIPNGIDPDSFPPPEPLPGRFRLIWVGRLTPEKGLAYLFQAMQRVLEALPQAQLSLIGDGPLRQELEDQARQLGIEENVRFLGLKPHAEVAHLINQADLLVLSSLQEGLPMVVLEAMVMARPVIATQVGGIPDVVVDDGAMSTGRLVAPQDPEALSRAILDLLQHPQLAQEMGARGRSRVLEHYTWSGIAQQTIEVYRSVLS